MTGAGRALPDGTLRATLPVTLATDDIAGKREFGGLALVERAEKIAERKAL